MMRSALVRDVPRRPRARTVAALMCALGVCALTQACTFFSGVEELELRSKTTAPDASAAETGAPGEGAGFDFFGGADSGASKPPASGTPPSTGQLCGALGSWTACETTALALTCADQCLSKGLSCVESCCAYDELGDYPAKVGMVYAVAGLTCEMASVPSTSSGGLCSDPILPLGDTRCCCR